MEVALSQVGARFRFTADSSPSSLTMRPLRISPDTYKNRSTCRLRLALNLARTVNVRARASLRTSSPYLDLWSGLPLSSISSPT